MPQGPDPRPDGPPTDHVIAMQRQGLSNNQITQYLQREGFTADQIFDAMNQASVKGSVENIGGDMFQGGQSQGGQSQENQSQAQFPPPPADQQFQDPMSGMGVPQEDRNEQIERVAEAIIEEKWLEFSKNVNKIIEWKEKTETTVVQLQQQFNDLKKNFDSLHEAVLGKVTEYDQNIVHLGVEIKAMEKVFQKILPTLTENVTELSQITKSFKGK